MPKRKAIHEYPKHIQDQIAEQLYARTAVSPANLEPHPSNEPEGAHAVKAFTQKVNVHFHSIRRRLADPDGISGKAALDAIVKAGILKDDRAEFIGNVTHSQEKGDTEKTIITITPVS